MACVMSLPPLITQVAMSHSSSGTAKITAVYPEPYTPEASSEIQIHLISEIALIQALYQLFPHQKHKKFQPFNILQKVFPLTKQPEV